MKYEEALALIDDTFDEWGYSHKQMASKSREVHVLKSKYGLTKCTHDWPAAFSPSEADLQATDWNIVNSTSEY